MRTILQLFILSASITAVNAQDAVMITAPTQSADDQVPVITAPAAPAVAAPTVVYDTPVVYTAPVVYQAPVTYYAPVSYNNYNTTPACTPAPAECEHDCGPVSTVVYIGGGHTAYQNSDACSNSGSTVTYIGGGCQR